MATPHPRARQPYGDPSHPNDPLSLSSPLRTIRFRHPNYPDENNILLQFSACDVNNGVHYQTAHDACAILTNNRWDGYLSTDIEGTERIEPVSPDESLQSDDYYFHLPEGKDYPIVPTFADWSFPHQNVPEHWSRQLHRSSADPISYRMRCCMTQSTLALENAHIVPANSFDIKWWHANGMSRYVTQTQAQHGHNSMSNKLRLKVDVHQIFDRKPRFAIVPKYNNMVAHFFSVEELPEAAELYHNVPLQDLDQVRIECLLARMAWTIFPHLGLFMLARRPIKVSRHAENGTRVTEELDGEQCLALYRQAQAKSSSISPRKRAMGQMRGEEDELEDEYSDEDDDEWETRGRKRTREDDEDDDEWKTRGWKRMRPSFGTPSGEELDKSGSEVSVSKDAIALANLQAHQP